MSRAQDEGRPEDIPALLKPANTVRSAHKRHNALAALKAAWSAADADTRGQFDAWRTESANQAAPKIVEPSTVPAWRVRKLRAALRDCQERGRRGDDGADLTHRAALRRFQIGFDAAHAPRRLALRSASPTAVLNVPHDVSDKAVRDMIAARAFVQVGEIEFSEIASTRDGHIFNNSPRIPLRVNVADEISNPVLAKAAESALRAALGVATGTMTAGEARKIARGVERTTKAEAASMRDLPAARGPRPTPDSKKR